MTDELLAAYDRELTYLRELGAEFARAHPKVAGRLRISSDSVEDPHVSRLIESVAFLNARVRTKLDDDLPELSDALLGVLAPHLLAPIPAMAIVKFDSVASATTSFEIEAGTAIESDPRYGSPCHFRTVYPVTAWSIEVREAALVSAPFVAPRVRQGTSAASVLRLSLAAREGQCPMGELGIDRLRFFLRGQPAHVQQLYELLLDDVICVAVAKSVQDPSPLVLGPEAVRPVGFEPREALLPSRGGTHPGHRLLADYFVFPAKFQFLDVVGLAGGEVAGATDRLEIFVYLRRSLRDLEQAVSEETFALGCAPVVNLFSRRAEPVELRSSMSEVHLMASARSPEAHEVYSVDAVSAVSRDGNRREYRPFYGVSHDVEGDDKGCFWHASRRVSPSSREERNPGTDVYLSLLDLEHGSASFAGWTLEAEVTCLNRNLPGRLPFGGAEPRLSFRSGGAGIEAIRALTPFTETLRPKRGRGAMWRLVSQLSLNQLSISGGEQGAESLREILRVNDLADTAVSRSVIASITSVRSRSTMVRVRQQGTLGFVRGREIAVDLEESRLGSSGAYLFSMILDRFLASYGSLNSFVQLVTTARSREEGVRRWTPRSGTRELG